MPAWSTQPWQIETCREPMAGLLETVAKVRPQRWAENDQDKGSDVENGGVDLGSQKQLLDEEKVWWPTQ